MNTQRSPLGGRGFESFSEDPHLNGTIAAAYINGLQSKGVASTIKHYVANDQEFERYVDNKVCPPKNALNCGKLAGCLSAVSKLNSSGYSFLH